MRWRGRSGSRDLNAIYTMYSSHHQYHDNPNHNMTEKGKETVTTSAQQWPLPSNGERPYTPNTFNSDRYDGTTSSSQGSHKRKAAAAALAEQKRRRKRTIVIVAAIVSGIVVVGLALGLGLGLTIGARDAEARRLAANEYYIPPVIQHTTPENDLMMQMFEWHVPKNGSHWTTLTRQLPNLKILGVKNMWIPPAAKNADRSLIGYDVYDLWDLGEFNTHGAVSTNMGSKKQLETLASKAQQHGIGLIFDAVLNQRSGADGQLDCNAHTVDGEDRLNTTGSSTTITAWLEFKFEERKGKYSSKTWGCDDFTAVDYDLKTGTQDTIYKIEGTDNDFEDDVSNEKGNYDFLSLADVAYRNPSVRADVLAWVKWVHESMPITGFRLDAAKHLSREFIKEVIQVMADTNNNQDKWFAAEFFTDNLQSMTDYIDDLDNRGKMFDTILLSNFAYLSQNLKKDLKQVYNNSFVKERPSQAVTFVTTHDTQLGQDLDTLLVQTWFLPIAYAIILLRPEGLPCLFYGDVYGAYNKDASSFTFAPKRQVIANLAIARKYWAYGTLTDYWDDDDTVGWTWQGIENDRPDGMAVVINNAKTMKSKKMNVGAQHAGETWSDITANIIMQTVTIGANGEAEFPCRGQSASVWVNENAKEGRDSLNQFDGDVYHIAPYEIGHATNDYESGGELGSQRQIAEGISNYRLDSNSQ